MSIDDINKRPSLLFCAFMACYIFIELIHATLFLVVVLCMFSVRLLRPNANVMEVMA